MASRVSALEGGELPRDLLFKKYPKQWSSWATEWGKLSSSRFARRGDFVVSSVSPDSPDSLEDPHFRELSRAQSYACEFPDPVCKSPPSTRVEKLIDGRLFTCQNYSTRFLV